MAHFLSRLWFPVLDALWCLVRMLFGRFSGPVVDPEGGTLTPVVTLKDEVVEKVPIPTFVPDFDSVPALILSSMVVGTAVSPKIADRVPAIIIAGGPPVPRIILTPPEDEPKPAQVVCIPIPEPVRQQQERKPQCGRTPLRSISNIAPRVHGKPASKTRSKPQKENIREHPNAPRVVKPSSLASRPNPSTVHLVQVAKSPKTINRAEFVKAIEALKRMHTEPDKAVEPGSSAWEQDKFTHLAQARAFSEDVKARRRRSLPTPSPASPIDPKPLCRSASVPGRLSIQERLHRAVADIKPVVRVPPLWGDDHVSFVVDEEEENDFDGPPEAQSTLPISASYNSVSSGGSLSSILNAFENDFKSPVWLERQRWSYADVESARSSSSGSSRDSTWSDVFSLQDYA